MSYTTPEIGGTVAGVAGYTQQPAAGGTYRLFDYTLERRYDDGFVVRDVIFVRRDKDSDEVSMVYLNGVVWTGSAKLVGQ